MRAVRRVRGVRAVALAGVVILCGVLLSGEAQATPAAGVSAILVSKTTSNGTDYVVRQITIQPGGSTGWHYHDGPLYALVVAGTLTHVMADCATVERYQRGSRIVEPSGAGYVHIGQNLGPKPVVLEVLYLLPTGSPYSEDAPDPGCHR